MIVWGSELSPYALKVRALFDAARLPYRWLPADGGRWENTIALARIAIAKRRRTVVRYPRTTPLDEYPLVPFVIDHAGAVLYDSSALARWVDATHAAAGDRLVPDDPALAFVAALIDEAFDEFGLYLVHHNRWVISAATNDAGARLAREFARVLPPGGGRLLARRFSARQVRRLPYLFSVAPPGFSLPGLAPALTPPARDGFPPTHALLDDAYTRYLDAVEQVLVAQPYLLGERFTLADAGAYGQLGMNLADPTAAERLRARAPRTCQWLGAIRDRRHVDGGGALRLSVRLTPLLAVIAETFVPLMQQNEAAYRAAVASGARRFNERAFERGEALYDGVLLGRPFRAVVKTFQVQSWRELCATWAALDDAAHSAVAALLPSGVVFG